MVGFDYIVLSLLMLWVHIWLLMGVLLLLGVAWLLVIDVVVLIVNSVVD